MTKYQGEGLLLFGGRSEPVKYNFEAPDSGGGYGRINGDFDLSKAVGIPDVALQLDAGDILSIRIRDAHEVTGSRFDIITDASSNREIASE